MTENTTASGAADDSLLLCASDLQHSAIYDNPHEMVDCVRAVADRITALAASAPVAPTRIDADRLTDRLMSSDPEFDDCADAASLIQKQAASIELLHVAICQAVTLLNAAVNPFRVVEANDILRHALVAYADSELANPEAAPVAPAPQPAPMPYPTDAQIDAVYEQTMGQHLRSQDAPAVRRFGRAMFLCAWNAAAPKADHIEDDLAMAPAPLQQGEYPETLYEGGRESVDDALAVVESFGPGVQGLNDTFARQVLLGQEVRRLRAAYEHACQGRSDFRNLYRAARGAAQAAPAPVAEDAANWHWLASYLVGPRTDLDDEIVASESVNDLRKLVSAARAQSAQPEGGAK